MFDYVLVIIAIAIVSFYAGWKVRELYALRQIFKMMKSAEKVESETKTVLKLEKHSDVIYAYNRETDEFLGQSETLSGLSEILNKRFPDVSFAVTQENLEELGVLDESV